MRIRRRCLKTGCETMRKKRILIIHGPNLNLLGSREPDIYGRDTLKSLNRLLERRARELNVRLGIYQSNHEGRLIDRIHRSKGRVSGILINPGGLTHTSVVLRDALTGVNIPVVEVHLSDIESREPFRSVSMIADLCAARFSGMGVGSYLKGLEFLAAGDPAKPADCLKSL